MLSDAGVDVIVADAAHRARAEGLGVRAVVELSNTEIEREFSPNDIVPECPAYIIYTSGSTGRPKGTAIPHRALAAFLDGIQPVLGMREGDEFFAATSFGFDISLLEIFGPLTTGGVVRMSGVTIAEDPIRAAREASSSRFIQATPSGWDLLLDSGALTPLPGTAALCGGEPLTPYTAERLLQGFSSVLNLYGPTEATIWVTAAKITTPHKISIGRPFLGVTCRILDDAQTVLQAGNWGELWIGGDTVGLGYVNAQQFTRERFHPDPDTDGGLCYRTGDLARLSDDGNLFIAGRIDDQLKVKGHRIEPEEIASIIRTHPRISQAVVVGTRNQDGQDVGLAAFVVAKQSEPDNPAVWNAHVRRWARIFSDYVPQTIDPDHPVFPEWISSVNNGQIPDSIMRAWLDATVERVLALEPKRVLEIGCGQGLVGLRVAQEADEYVGVDASDIAISQLRHIAKRYDGRLTAIVSDALSWVNDVEGEFDTIVLNSVVQYFPSKKYLMKVLESARLRLAPGGTIFVGDVKHLLLRDKLRPADVAPLEHETTDPRWETELAVHPLFWLDSTDGLSVVRVAPKKPSDESEMSRFRYDVWLQRSRDAISVRPERGVEPSVVRWGLDVKELDEFVRVVSKDVKTQVVLEGVPNGRIVGHSGLDPSVFWSLRLPGDRVADVSFARGLPDGSFDVAVAESTAAAARMVVSKARIEARPTRMANTPGSITAEAALTQDLIDMLRLNVPEYMIPHAIHFRPKLPLTPAGKVDRVALRAETGAMHTARQKPARRLTSTENQICAILSEMLVLSPTSGDDDFFAMGGDSLSLSRFVVAVNNKWNIELPPSLIRRRRTVAAIAEEVESLVAGRRGPAKAADEKAAEDRFEPSEEVPRLFSFEQEQIWWAEELAGDHALFNVAASWTLADGYDLATLQAALDRITRRHDALRSNVVEIDGLPHQATSKSRRITIRSIGPEGPHSSVNWAHKDISRRGSPSAFAAGLVEGKHPKLILAGHHAFLDARSLEILEGDISAELRREMCDAPRRQMSSIQAAQRHLARPVDPTFLRRWVNANRMTIEVPPSLKTSPDDTLGGSGVVMPSDWLARLLYAARSSASTPFAILLARLAFGLAEHLNRRVVCIGIPASTRDAVDEHVVGCFVALIPVVFRVGALDPLVQTVTERLEMLAELVHQPLESVDEASRDAFAPHDVFVDAVLTFDKIAAPRWPLGRRTEISLGRPRYPLHVAVTEHTDRMTIAIETSTITDDLSVGLLNALSAPIDG
jgi:amino acid adenylation domain-containing protein